MDLVGTLLDTTKNNITSLKILQKVMKLYSCYFLARMTVYGTVLSKLEDGVLQKFTVPN